MKSYSTLAHEFSAWQRKELEALFIVLDWTKNFQENNPNNPVGREWVDAIELAIRIIYDDAFSAWKNRGIVFHSGSDTTEAPPDVIRNIIEDLSKYTCSPCVEMDSSNYYYFGNPSTSSDSDNTYGDMVNFMYFGPAYRITESGNSSTEDVPFGFQFPHSMHFNFGDKQQKTSTNLASSAPTLPCQSTKAPSAVSFNESEQKEMFLPFPAMYLVQPTTSLQMQESTKLEVPEIFESSQSDLTKYFGSSLESQSSNPAIEFFRISSGFKAPPKNSEIAKWQCTSPFCLCSSVKAAFKNETDDDSLEENDENSEVSVEPYLEVENITFPKLELPDLLDDTPESYMLAQPFNTPHNNKDLDASYKSVKDRSFSTPRAPRNNCEDRELLLQPFNTTVTARNISESSGMDASLDDSLGVADLSLDEEEDIPKMLPKKCPMDNDHEYIRQERLRILFSYEKSRLAESKKANKTKKESNKNKDSACSTSNSRNHNSRKDEQ